MGEVVLILPARVCVAMSTGVILICAFPVEVVRSMTGLVGLPSFPRAYEPVGTVTGAFQVYCLCGYIKHTRYSLQNRSKSAFKILLSSLLVIS